MGNDLPNRRSIRLKGFNYSGPGTHFLTICTLDREYLFGRIQYKQMNRSPWGEIAHQEWLESLRRRPHVVPIEFLIMPNHVHALVVFDPDDQDPNFDLEARDLGLKAKSVGSLMNGYKGAVTKAIRLLTGDPLYEVWQSNYYDHVVRDQQDFETIEWYIQHNPSKWDEDKFNLHTDD